MGQRVVWIGVNEETGETAIEAEGFKDDSCFLATKPFEEALGTVSERVEKPTAKVKARSARRIVGQRCVPSGHCG